MSTPSAGQLDLEVSSVCTEQSLLQVEPSSAVRCGLKVQVPEGA